MELYNRLKNIKGKNNEEELEQLLVSGYQLMNDQSLKCYFDVISRTNSVDDVSLDDVFYSSK